MSRANISRSFGRRLMLMKMPSRVFAFFFEGVRCLFLAGCLQAQMLRLEVSFKFIALGAGCLHRCHRGMEASMWAAKALPASSAR